VGGGSRKNLVRCLALAVAAASILVAPAAATRGGTTVVAWQAPTPASGSVVQAGAGTKLSVQLTAGSVVPTSSVHIEPAGKLPRGAKLTSTDGNPARATLTWTPAGRQIGDHTLRFTAVDNTPLHQPASPLVLTTRVVAGTLQLSGVQNVSRWAFVLNDSVVRSAPSSGSHVLTRLGLWTPEYYPNLALALQERINRSGTWVRIRLPILPNNSTGWIRRGVLGSFHSTRDHLVVDKAATTAILLRNGVPLFTTRVGVGTSFWPTPSGEFYIREKMSGFHAAAYGPIAFGTSARSSVLTDWPGGGYIGIHGTDAPGLIPGHVSHGCVRLRNASILQLARLLGIGTPLTIR
jgi:L,D-transpeptidase catalytic domain